MFDKARQLIKLRQTSQKLQKQLQQEVLEVVHRNVVVEIQGDLKLRKLATNSQDDAAVMEAVNKAIVAAQKEAALKMRGQMGDLQDLLGGGF